MSLHPDDPVVRLIDRARAHPRRPAVIASGDARSYEAFVEQTRRIAGAIAAVGEHPRVLVRVEQGADAYAAMFGTLMAGGSYAPVNLDAPAIHQDRVRDEFRPDVIVGTPREGDMAPVVDGSAPAAAPLDAPRPPDELAYTIFTSGSTGAPKGVMIPRDGLRHYIAWAIPALRLREDDRVSQHPNIGFDLSVLDIFASLCSGAGLVPVTGARDRLFPAEVIRDHAITVWISVPSVIDLMAKAGHVTGEHLASVERLFFCGEPLLPSHLRNIFAARPGCEVINAYGPTEATVSCTELRLHGDDWLTACAGTVALGNPIDGMSVEIDGSREQGEIIISGPQLAAGYWNDTARTAASFVEEDGRRVYRSGDVARRQGDHLYFRRRVDRQIKLHGHRIELGEIDAALRGAGVEVAYTCVARERLVSFVEGDAHCSPDSLRDVLATMLPPYAVPRDIRVMPALPRNANDKIDGSELQSLARDDS